MNRLRNVASSRVTILLRGATGTGKEVLASAIHQISGRVGPFQPVNCAAIPAGLVESELFGHRRGAFSGAVEDQPGIIRGADRGTLLLDEVGDLPLPAQAALLRVLQEGEVAAVGGARASKVDLRVIAATHRNLEEMVESGLFRADLLARLSGYVCTLPPLRERLEDFSLLVSSLLSRIGASNTELSAEVARALLRYPWPLNIRELEKALSSAVALSAGGVIDLEHLPEAIRAAPAKPRNDPAKMLREELIGQLRAHGGNISAVARAMGKARTQIQRWIRKFDLDPFSFHR
jgi:transcriptional regulator with PAS, ATPase and Fis domain